MPTDETEELRLVYEARDWLRRGYTTEAKAKDLGKLITSKRGKEAWDRLYREMREQWKTKNDWMEK
ncbi:MAG: DUF7696 family protein [Alcanivorax sp.]